MKLKTVVSILAAITLLSCSGREWSRKIDWPGIDRTDLPTNADFPDDPAVVLLDEGTMEIRTLSENAFSIYDRHTIIKIFNERGFRYANIAVPYGAHSEVDDIEARTIGPDGSITVLDDQKIYDVSLYPNFVFFSDQRAKIFTLPAVNAGCIIEYRYRLTINSMTYGNQWRFQSEIPVLRSRFTLIRQAEWEIDYRMHGAVSEPVVSGSQPGSRQTMSWEAGPFNPLRPEIFMPPLSETGARLTFAPFGIKSWSELSDWYHNLAEPSLQKRNGLEELAAGLTADLKTDEDKLKALFEWTRDQIRYIAVEIGIGGYQPSPAEEVLAVRYGDCKDMTTLLCALAEEINIPVYPALISTRQNGIPDTTLPSATQFNHIIAFAPTIGSGGTWMDATEKSCGFRSLPWYDQDMPVLLIAPDGNGRLLRTPASNPEDNRSETRWQVQLFPDGIAEVTATASYCGVVADEIRHILRSLSPADRFEWQEQILAERTSGARLDSLRVLNLDTPGLPLEIYYTFKDPDIFQQLPGLMILEPGILSGERLYALFRPEKRIHPVRLQIPAESSFSLSLDLPEDWYPAIASNQLIQESSYGTCRFTWKFHDRRLETGVWVTTPAQEIFPAEYLDFLAYLENSRIILETPIQILHNPDE